MPKDARKQLLVEIYFRPVLTKYFYWIGLSRTNDTTDFTFVDGSAVHPNTSAVPYAHWDWVSYSSRNISGQCGTARYNTSFDYYLGAWPPGIDRTTLPGEMQGNARLSRPLQASCALAHQSCC